MGSVPYFLIPPLVVLALAVIIALHSFHSIGPSEIGLVTKRVGKKLGQDQLIAMNGEAGYQAELLMPGVNFKLWPLFAVKRYPRVQVPPDHIGLVISQVGQSLPNGAKSAVYKPKFGDFADLALFMSEGGQRGVQRKVLNPGATAPIHPIGFVVVTSEGTFGEVLSDATDEAIGQIDKDSLKVLHITPQGDLDVVGVVTTLEGPPSNDFASRIGGFDDIEALEEALQTAPEGDFASSIIQKVLASKNHLHDNYQDFQAFIANGGRIGLQHDPLSYGAYVLNPLLVKVELVPMLVVLQGEVAVIKAYVGLPTKDTSGEEFKFGSIVSPGHQGIWSEPLRTGKYPLNPRIYGAEIVPTSILTLNWSQANSEAHDLDKRLSPIDAKSKEAFDFSIDLQVQIHVPDTKAPKVISMVGTMANLVNEVLQSAVGNYFRNALQELGATEFIEKRGKVQKDAEAYIDTYLGDYQVETKGVYIQDVVFPKNLVDVLTSREIAAQEKQTYVNQQAAQEARVALEQQRGIAEMQSELARANVSVQIETSNAAAAVAKAEGDAKVTVALGEAEATKITAIGAAEASAEEAKGLAKAKAYEAQKHSIGGEQTALVAVLHEISDGNVKITPDIVVGGEGGILGGIGAMLMRSLESNGRSTNGAAKAPEPELATVSVSDADEEKKPDSGN
ncbi:MAG: hypothetical protein JWS12_783 [Candidatus Saccharibacteria bacterium]|nr:hypothetical protein [Candidatus Saccharibacteria bacterium]